MLSRTRDRDELNFYRLRNDQMNSKQLYIVIVSSSSLFRVRNRIVYTIFAHSYQNTFQLINICNSYNVYE